MAGVPEGRLKHKAGWEEASMADVDQFEGVQRAWTPDEMRRVYAEQPDDADRIVFGRRSADRRGFLKGAGLATMGAMLGAAIPFHRNMPAGVIPAAFAQATGIDPLKATEGLMTPKHTPENAGTTHQ